MRGYLSEEDKIFGKRLNILRKKHGYKQATLAALINIDQSELSKLERGVRHGNFRVAASAAKVFNTSIDYLLGLTDITDPYPPAEK